MIIPTRLCELYNDSDIDAIDYIIDNTEDMAERKTAIGLHQINMETSIGYGDRIPAKAEENFYYNEFWKILNKYGITKTEDDRACIEGEYYPTGI